MEKCKLSQQLEMAKRVFNGPVIDLWFKPE